MKNPDPALSVLHPGTLGFVLAGGPDCLALLRTNSDESLTLLYVNKYKVFIFHRLLQHAK